MNRLSYTTGRLARSARPRKPHGYLLKLQARQLLGLPGSARFQHSKSEASGTADGRPFSYAPWVLAAAVALLPSVYMISRRDALNSNKTSLKSTLPLSQAPELQHDVSDANLRAARSEILAIVGPNGITDRPDEIERHTSSTWSTYPVNSSDAPHFVVYPTSTEQVSQVMAICHRRRVPLVAFSGGTSLEGNFANLQRGISIDVSRMNRILAIHADDMDAVVQPGVSYAELNEALAANGLFFPPDPGPGAMIGGMVGTGCSGTNAYRYGTMKDWVINLTVVLADGTVIKTLQRPRKSSAGYDLTRLFVGSEGTLGIVTEAVVKLTARPANERVSVLAFGSVRDACTLVIRAVQAGVPLAAIELIGATAMKVLNEAGVSDKVWQEAPSLFLKFSGSERGVAEDMAAVSRLARENGAIKIDEAANADEAEELWDTRKNLAFIGAGLKRENDSVWITDVAVPISRLAEIVEMTQKDIDDNGLFGTIVGHVGDGNFHAYLLYSPEEKEKAERVVDTMVERAIEMEGTITGEHGIGITKRALLEKELGKDTVDFMRKIKQAVDPLCLLNCDKVLQMKRDARSPTSK